MGDTHLVPVRVQNVIDMDIIRLNLWSIKFNASSVRLEGFVRNEDGNMMQKYTSEIICKRMTNTLLLDVSGRFFELVGQIDREFQVKNGMPSQIVDEFQTGFPENWAFLINRCITSAVAQWSGRRPIEAPKQSEFRQQGKPIVTLADDTEISNETTNMKKSDVTKGSRSEEMKKKKGNEEKNRIEEEEDMEEDEEEEGDFTFRAPRPFNDNAFTPIRWERRKPSEKQSPTKLFEETPKRNRTPIVSAPVASSTPQINEPKKASSSTSSSSNSQLPPPPPKPEPVRRNSPQIPEIFAVPNIVEKPKPKKASGFNLLDEMDNLFDNFEIDKTPARDSRKATLPRRLEIEAPPQPPPPPRRLSPIIDRSYRSSQNSSYNDSIERYRNRRDYDERRYSPRRDDSRMSRKRYPSPGYEDDYYQRRKEDRYRNRSRYDDYDDGYRHRSREMERDRDRHRQTSPSAGSNGGRSVRFEHDDYDRRRDRHYRDRSRSRSREYSRYDRSRNDDKRYRREEEREDPKLKEICKREKELKAKLENNRRKQEEDTRRKYSDSEEDPDQNDTLLDEWDRENQDMLAKSAGRVSKPKRMNVKREPVKKEKKDVEPKPKKVAAPKVKKTKSPEVDLDESIAKSKPKRVCATPATATPAKKRITWPRRELDKLKRIIEMKKPSGSEEDWKEVTRLLAKDGIEFEECKQTAMNRLKWKEPVVQEAKKNDDDDEEEGKKRRRGVAGAVKEDLKMREQMANRDDNKQNDLLREENIETVDSYEPADVSADESLLALGTPITYTEAIRQKGGKRKSIMLEPVEDSPIAKSSNSSLERTPARMKELECTMKYVQHLSNMSTSNLHNRSVLNATKNAVRGRKNVSMTVEEGAEKAMKIMKRGGRKEVVESSDDSDDNMDMIEEEDENSSMMSP